MDAYAIRRKLSESGKIDSFHFHLFHGKAELSGMPWWITSRTLDDDLSQPLQLSSNGFRIPHVFQPTLNFVVSAEVKQKLHGLPHVGFVKVQFKKLIRFPYSVGDFSYYDRPDFLRDPERFAPDTLIDRLSDEPLLHKQIGSYYELIPAKGFRVATSCQALTTIHLPAGDPADCHEMIELQLSPRLLDDYPVLWNEVTILHERVFSLIESFIDWNFFWLHKIELLDRTL